MIWEYQWTRCFEQLRDLKLALLLSHAEINAVSIHGGGLLCLWLEDIVLPCVI